MRGQITYIPDGKKPGVLGSLGDANELKSIIKSEDWNDLDVLARGNTIVQLINGRVTSMLIDDDTANRRMDGLIGIQIHVGPPMKIEARNIRLKKL
jgi:predicted alpha/beta-hydrolase family hydrolase